MRKTRKLCLDRISSLPHPIIETILSLVPFKDVVRTSILSKKWRYSWVKIPKLVLDDADMFAVMHVTHNYNRYLEGKMADDYKRLIYNAIHKVLFLHDGPIHEFTLILQKFIVSVEIDQIITHLSKNNNSLKKFKLDFTGLYRLPLSIFSLHQLTDLYLHLCHLDFEPPFSGFPCLTTLHLQLVKATTRPLIHLLSKSPLLKSFTLIIADIEIYDDGYLFNPDEYTLTDLFNCLPVIEHFCVSMLVIEDVFCPGVVPQELPRELPPSLVHLKYLTLDEVSFHLHIPFVLLMISCSPNLEKLKIKIYEEWDSWEGMTDDVTYSDISLEHLKELEIVDFGNMEFGLNFVKFILTKSPVLKKVIIFLDQDVLYGSLLVDEVKMLRILLRTPRASPMVEIIVDHSPTKCLGRVDPLCLVDHFCDCSG